MSPAYDALVEWLRERFGESLRWVASFDSDRYTYRVRHVREDLRGELTEQQLDVIIHRSMAVYSRHRLEDVYRHLGTAHSMVVGHERATAVHLYLQGSDGVVVKLAPEASVTTPAFTEEAMAVLFPEQR